MELKIKDFKIKRRHKMTNTIRRTILNFFFGVCEPAYYYYDVVITANRDGHLLYRYEDFFIQLPDGTRLVILNINYSSEHYDTYEIHAMTYEPSTKNLLNYKPETATILTY